MRGTEGKLGRVFVLRLENGDAVPGCIEDFARSHGIKAGSVLLIGGVGGGQVVSGPRDSAALPPEPMLLPLDGAHEVIGVGFIALNKGGVPKMHMHAALGRAGNAKTGCVRPGITVWHVGEVVIYEVVDVAAVRLPDEATGFELLQVGEDKSER